MTITNALANTLTYRVFSNDSRSLYSNEITECLNFNLDAKFLLVDIAKKNHFFLPAININGALTTIKKWLFSESHDLRLVYPLYALMGSQKRTGESIIASLFDVVTRARLKRVTSPNGQVFYGGQGMILTNDGGLMMISGYDCHIDDSFDPDLPRIVIDKAQCLVHPAVFDQQDLVSKVISKKVIPYMASESICSTNSITYNLESWISVDSSRTSVEMVVTRKLPCLSGAIIPYDTDNLETDIWDFIEINRNDFKC